MFIGIGVAGAALIGVGAFVAGQLGSTPVVPAPATAQAEVDQADEVDEVAAIAVAAAEPGRRTPAPPFDLLATVADPVGYSNVRDAPSVSGRIVGRAEVGKAFTTYNQRGAWWQVRLPDGTTGYIARSRIRLSGESEGVAASGGGARPANEPDRRVESPTVNPSDMTFPDSSKRLLAASELAQLGPSMLKIARNEIYARKGRRFRDPRLRDYFSKFAWYQPRYDDVSLNRIEQRNVVIIKAAEGCYQ